MTHGAMLGHSWGFGGCMLQFPCSRRSGRGCQGGVKSTGIGAWAANSRVWDTGRQRWNAKIKTSEEPEAESLRGHLGGRELEPGLSPVAAARCCWVSSSSSGARTSCSSRGRRVKPPSGCSVLQHQALHPRNVSCLLCWEAACGSRGKADESLGAVSILPVPGIQFVLGHGRIAGSLPPCMGSAADQAA